jgi:diguanylate cyclase (GGDEF)-like protein
VQRAAFGVAMLVAGAIGIGELAIALHDLPRAAREANGAAARVYGAYVGASLRNRVDEVRQLADSSLVWTALSDSRGRDIYLKPFLQERNLALTRSRLALLDYRGRFVAGEKPLSTDAEGATDPVVDAVLTLGEPFVRMSDDEDRPFRIGVPVIYPYTKDVIGVLVGALDPVAMLDQQPAAELQGRGVVIRGGDMVRTLHGDAGEPAYAAASYRIRHPLMPQLYDLELEVYSVGNPWLGGLIKRSLALVGLSILVAALIWWIAGLAARRVSRRLERLVEAVGARQGGGPEAIPVDREGDEISVLGEALREALTAHHAAKQQLQQLAYYDPLTGLMNRALFDEVLSSAMHRATRTETSLALLFIDLDRFKAVNDTLGHEAGDALLRAVAQRIEERVRRSDGVSRRSGDEFTVLMEPCNAQKDAARLAEQLIALLSAPYRLSSGATAVIGASVGVAFFPEDAVTAGDLLRCADTAMYAAKEQGAGCYRVYSPEQGAAIRTRLEIESRLSNAVDNGCLEILYQPQVALGDARLQGVEAFCRWRDPELGEVSPRVFIPIAEECGLMRALGACILRQALRDVASWDWIGPDFFLAVNLSPKQLTEDFVQLVAQLLKEHQPGFRLELELTEAALLQATGEEQYVLGRLRELGVGIVIDNFGAGYSSLSCLQRCEISKIKIDGAVIRGLVREEPIIGAIIDTSHRLGLQAVAEGIETSAQRARLERQGCDLGQGYLFGRPKSPAAMCSLFRIDDTA